MDCIKLHTALEQVSTLCNNKKVVINISKYYVVTDSLKHNVLLEYSLYQSQLLGKTSLRTLSVRGVWQEISFDHHISSAIKNASGMLGFTIVASRDFASKKNI